MGGDRGRFCARARRPLRAAGLGGGARRRDVAAEPAVLRRRQANEVGGAAAADAPPRCIGITQHPFPLRPPAQRRPVLGAEPLPLHSPQEGAAEHVARQRRHGGRGERVGL